MEAKPKIRIKIIMFQERCHTCLSNKNFNESELPIYRKYMLFENRTNIQFLHSYCYFYFLRGARISANPRSSKPQIRYFCKLTTIAEKIEIGAVGHLSRRFIVLESPGEEGKGFMSKSNVQWGHLLKKVPTM